MQERPCPPTSCWWEAKDAENDSPKLIIEILRGMRDTADFEEEWGDETEASIEKAMMTSSLFHSPKFSTLVAAYRAQDLEDETRAQGEVQVPQWEIRCCVFEVQRLIQR